MQNTNFNLRKTIKSNKQKIKFTHILPKENIIPKNSYSSAENCSTTYRPIQTVELRVQRNCKYRNAGNNNNVAAARGTPDGVFLLSSAPIPQSFITRALFLFLLPAAGKPTEETEHHHLYIALFPGAMVALTRRTTYFIHVEIDQQRTGRKSAAPSAEPEKRPIEVHQLHHLPVKSATLRL